MRRIRRENVKIYKSNYGAILHTDAKIPDVIGRIATVTERKSTGCLTEAMVTGDGIIKEGYFVDVLPDASHGNNIMAGTGCLKKVDKCNNESTTMSVKLDFYVFIYHNIPLKILTKVDILNRIYSDKKKRKCCDNTIKKETKKPKYTNNDVHVNIDQKLQKISKIRVLIMILRGGVQKNIQRSFVEFQKNFIGSIFIRAIVRKIGWIWKLK